MAKYRKERRKNRFLLLTDQQFGPLLPSSMDVNKHYLELSKSLLWHKFRTRGIIQPVTSKAAPPAALQIWPRLPSFHTVINTQHIRLKTSVIKSKHSDPKCLRTYLSSVRIDQRLFYSVHSKSGHLILRV